MKMKRIMSFIPSYGNEIRYNENEIQGFNFYENGEKIKIKTLKNNDKKIIKNEIKRILEENKKNEEMIKSSGGGFYGGREYQIVDNEIVGIPA